MTRQNAFAEWTAEELAVEPSHWLVAYDAAGLVLAPIALSERGADPERISIGRARDGDIVVRDPSVSKLHAHFRPSHGALTLTDVGSHNGTCVDGVILVAHRPRPITAGARIFFGRLEARVLSARDAHEAHRSR